MPLPKKVRAQKACINIQNTDNKCFLYCILASLHPAEHNPQRVSKYTQYTDELDFAGIDFPVKISDVKRFESNNNHISVNIYCLDGDNKVFPLRISSQIDAPHHADLLYLNQSDISHYVLIKNFSRLLSSQISHHAHQMFFCKRCLHPCSSQDVLSKHLKCCLNHKAQAVKMPDSSNNIIKFTKIEKQLRLPFVIYADFESCLIKNHHAERDGNSSWTEKFEEHQACSFSIHTVSSDKRFFSKPIMYFGEDAGEVFLNTVTAEIKKIRSFLRKPEPLPTLTDEEENEYKEASHCHICEEIIETDDIKVRYSWKFNDI